MTELLYLFRLKHKENRTFDFCTNGPLSRFLLGATCDNPGTTFALNNLLTTCVRVEPRSQIEWWLAGRYQWCNWGFELSYNLFWRDKERICAASFPDFDNTAIFDMTCGTLTSNSTATVCQTQAERVHDAVCTPIDPKNINLASPGAARRTLSNTIAGSVFL